MVGAKRPFIESCQISYLQNIENLIQYRGIILLPYFFCTQYVPTTSRFFKKYLPSIFPSVTCCTNASSCTILSSPHLPPMINRGLFLILVIL